MPPKAPQKQGDHPLGECIADNSIETPFGTGCWNLFFVSGGPFNGDLAPIDTNDSRMQQVTYANGRLWGALDTGVTVGGETGQESSGSSSRSTTTVLSASRSPSRATSRWKAATLPIPRSV